MSWDIFVQDLPKGIASVAEIPDDFEPGHIGTRNRVIDAIRSLYPESNFTDPAWGTLELAGCSIEFNLGSSELLQSFAMHVRGGESAPDVIAHILQTLGLQALDPSSVSGLFQRAAAARSQSYDRWLVHRGKLLVTGS